MSPMAWTIAQRLGLGPSEGSLWSELQLSLHLLLMALLSHQYGN